MIIEHTGESRHEYRSDEEASKIRDPGELIDAVFAVTTPNYKNIGRNIHVGKRLKANNYDVFYCDFADGDIYLGGYLDIPFMQQAFYMGNIDAAISMQLPE